MLAHAYGDMLKRNAPTCVHEYTSTEDGRGSKTYIELLSFAIEEHICTLLASACQACPSNLQSPMTVKAEVAPPMP